MNGIDSLTKERPILFNGEMVRAILDGRKTQTRRVVKPQPISAPPVHEESPDPFQGMATYQRFFTLDTLGRERWSATCPFGETGDRLWLRETWRPFINSCHSGIRYRANDEAKSTVGQDYEHLKELVKRTGGELSYDYGNWGDPHPDEVRQRNDWRPSIHMPRWASRITLEVKSVRVERLQDISETDAIAEGVDAIPLAPAFLSHRTSFAGLWDLITKDPAYKWESNPYVWVITFNNLQRQPVK